MKNTVADRLKLIREDRNKTKEQVANYLEIQLRAYQRYEAGERVPDLEKLKSLAKYFNCTLDYLVGMDIPEDKKYIDRDLVLNQSEIMDLGYNKKFAFGLMKQIIDHQSESEEVHVSENDNKKYVTKAQVRKLLEDFLEKLYRKNWGKVIIRAID